MIDSQQVAAHRGSDEYAIGDYWAIVYRGRGMILAVTGAAVVTAFAISAAITPRYEARAMFYVPSDVMVPENVSGQERTDVRTPSGDINAARAYMGILKGGDAARAVQRRFPTKTVADVARDLDFGVSREGLVHVYSRDKDSQLAADIANACVDYFNEFAEATVEKDLAETVQRLDERIGKVNADLSDAIHAKQLFDETHGISSLETALQELERSRIDLKEILLSAVAEERSAREELTAAAEQLSIESDIYRRGAAVLDDNLITFLQEAVAGIAMDIAEKGTALSLDHPEVLGLQEKFKVAKQNLNEALERIAGSPAKAPGTLYEELRGKKTILWVEARGQTERILALQDAIAVVDERIAELPAMLGESQRLDDAIRSFRGLKLALQRARDNRQVGALNIIQTAIAVETAVPPESPIFPILWLNILVATATGLITGVLAALTFEYVENARRRKRFQALAIESWALQAIDEQTSS